MSYWSLELPGLTREAAEGILHFAASHGLAEQGSLVDPNVFLTLHLDAVTVQSMLAVLRQGLAAAGTDQPPPDAAVVLGMEEVLNDWLENRR